MKDATLKLAESIALQLELFQFQRPRMTDDEAAELADWLMWAVRETFTPEDDEDDDDGLCGAVRENDEAA